MSVCRRHNGTAEGGQRRSALILVVVLIMVALLALLAASYAFMVHANISTVMAEQDRFMARMAAESGVQRALVMLQRNPDDASFTSDVAKWFDNEDEFHGAVVSGAGEGMAAGGISTLRERSETKDTYDPQAKTVWRYSLMAPNYDDPETVRYGFTDECSKLDLNLATEAQLRQLFTQIIPDNAEFAVDIDVLVDSLLDWRETGNTPRENGAKDDYYGTLTPPYMCKKAPFSSVEELLLVRGFNAWVVFGEDYNRNGLLNANEDDGDETFPPDNADNMLFPGVAAYLTVWSREMNTANDNRPRINLNLKDVDKLQEKLQPYIDGNTISYILRVRSAGKLFNSVMNLVPAPPPPEEEETGTDASQPADESGESTQGNGAGATSQPGGENAGAGAKGSSDLDQTGQASEKKAAGGSTSQPTSQPAYQNLTDEEPPCAYEDLPILLDRLTVATVPQFTGRINVSTAPVEVLATMEDLTDAELEALVAARRNLAPEEKATPAWLLTKNVMDENKFRRILDKITTKSSVYRIESVGYADDRGVVARLNVVVEMRGPIAQVLYYRDLTPLGPSYRPHGDERVGPAGGTGSGVFKSGVARPAATKSGKTGTGASKTGGTTFSGTKAGGGTGAGGTRAGGTGAGGARPGGSGAGGTRPGGTGTGGTAPGGSGAGGTGTRGPGPAGAKPGGTGPSAANPGGTKPTGSK